jgi:hypothetical protein
VQAVNAACQVGTARPTNPMNSPLVLTSTAHKLQSSLNLFDAAIFHRVGLVAGQQGGEVLHHQWVGIQIGERRPVVLAALPQQVAT